MIPRSAPYEARNHNVRPVLIDLRNTGEDRERQYERRRDAIRAHRNGERKPVPLGPTLSVVVV